MRITYIEHSGFAVKWQNCSWIFDYCRGELPVPNPEKSLYVFVSHAHQDHFEPGIFSMLAGRSRVTYIFSTDLHKKVRQIGLSEKQQGQIVWIAPEQELRLQDANGEKLYVRTLHSTDCGVAFLNEYRGRKIFHAGDLNCWVWEEDSKRDRKDMTDRYEREIRKLSGVKLDCAFLPVDYRLEKAYAVGPRYFMKHVDVSHVFPMHLWGRYSFAEKFRNSFEDLAWRERILRMAHSGQQWDYGIVQHIAKPDFACAGSREGETATDKVSIRLDDGSFCVREADDRELLARGIGEGSSVLLDDEEQIRL